MCNDWRREQYRITPSHHIVISLLSVISVAYLTDNRPAVADCNQWMLPPGPIVGPGPHSSHALAYDLSTGVTILFGGITSDTGSMVMLSDKTWIWNATTWTMVATPISPAARYSSAMAYDCQRRVVVHFGGTTGMPGEPCFRDTWEWDGLAWVERTPPLPALSPPAREGHAMVFDARNHVTVLFGGHCPSTAALFNDMWVWDGATWIERPVSGSWPSPRRGHAMSYDSARERIVLFGGTDGSNDFNDTWEWSSTTLSWMQVCGPCSGPSVRWGTALAYDCAREKTILFGGRRGSFTGYDDTWEWNGAAWSPCLGPGPTGRAGHAMVFDTHRGRAVLVGGYCATDVGCVLGDTWVYGAGTPCLPSPCGDCNSNGIPDACDISCGQPGGSCDVPGCGQSQDCNTNGTLDVCELSGHDCNTNGTYDSCEISGHDCNSNRVLDVCESGDCDSNGVPDVCQTDSDGDGTVDGCDPYRSTVLCSAPPGNPIILAPALISFSDKGVPQAMLPQNLCAGYRCFEMYVGRVSATSDKINRVTQRDAHHLAVCFAPLSPACGAVGFGPQVCSPQSVLVDTRARWPGACRNPNLVIVGGCDTIYFVNPINGAICEQFPDSGFCGIAQMDINSLGFLYVGSVNCNLLSVVVAGSRFDCYTAATSGPLRAVVVDPQDTVPNPGFVYVVGFGDGVTRKLDSFCMPVDELFATGLQGARAMAIAPPGLYHGNIFVACGDRVMEVDRVNGGAATLFMNRAFMSGIQADGIGFDPEGNMYISDTDGNRILKILPGLPGDMNGSRRVDLADVPGFVAALLQRSDAPLPLTTADMNRDGCADGDDARLFVEDLIH